MTQSFIKPPSNPYRVEVTDVKISETGMYLATLEGECKALDRMTYEAQQKLVETRRAYDAAKSRVASLQARKIHTINLIQQIVDKI